MIKNNSETMLNFIKAYSKVSIVRPGRSRAWILPFWSKTDINSLKQNLCLAPDQKTVRTKKVANDQKNQFGIIKFFGPVFVKQHNLSFPRIKYDIVFSTKIWCLSANQSGIEKL